MCTKRSFVGNGASQGHHRTLLSPERQVTESLWLPQEPAFPLVAAWPQSDHTFALPSHGIRVTQPCLQAARQPPLVGQGSPPRSPCPTNAQKDTFPPSPTCGSHTDHLPAPRNTRVLLPCGFQVTCSSSRSARAGLVSTLPPPCSPQQRRARGEAPYQAWLHTDRLAAFLGRCR